MNKYPVWLLAFVIVAMGFSALWPESWSGRAQPGPEPETVATALLPGDRTARERCAEILEDDPVCAGAEQRSDGGARFLKLPLPDLRPAAPAQDAE